MTKRAKTYDEIKPLIELCKNGRLFDVQAWIKASHPINSPPPPEKGARKKSPLQVAIDCGFHSLAQVLLEAGAEFQDERYNALEHALSERRLDIIKLLVKHGADIHSLDMAYVFDAWDPKIIEYFIEQGADVETGRPLASALCWRIRTALGVYKRHKDHFPSFQEQINIALRHHCKEGNLKWVSLILWAGADPLAKGADNPDDDPDPDEDLCALEYAALYGHFDIFKLKQIRLDPNHSISEELMRWACRADTADFLKELIKNGFKPDGYENSGSSLIQACISNMGWTFDFYSSRQRKDIDNSESREKIKMIYLLAEKGAKWMPGDRYEVNDARRSLLKMKPDYTVEFIWIMSKFSASTRENIEQLIRTPTMRALLSAHQTRVNELVESFD